MYINLGYLTSSSPCMYIVRIIKSRQLKRERGAFLCSIYPLKAMKHNILCLVQHLQGKESVFQKLDRLLKRYWHYLRQIRIFLV